MMKEKSIRRRSSVRKELRRNGDYMKFNLNNKYFRWGLTAFLVVVASILFYSFVFHGANIKAGLDVLVSILMPVVWGLAIAYLLTPVLNFVERKILFPICKRLRLKESKKEKTIVRGISIILTAFLFIGLIYLLFYMMLSQIVPSVQNIISNFDSYTKNFNKWLNQIMDANPDLGNSMVKVVDKFTDELEVWLNDLVPNSAGLIKTVSVSVINVFGFLWDFVIGFVISIYVLASKEKFAAQAKKIAYALLEKDTANVTIRNFRFTHRTFIGFLSGKIIDSIIIGILCFVGTSIMHMPYSALVSVIIGVTNVIPFFGPYLGAIPSTVLIFVVDPAHPLNCLYFVLFILILQQVDGNIIGPKILGNSTGLTGFWIIFAITLFGGLFGIVGMIVGVPIFAVIYAAIKSVINTMLRKKNMPIDLRKYERVDFVDEEGTFHNISEGEQDKKSKEMSKARQKIIDRIQQMKKQNEDQ
jgi:predicted PurR-regulated permease PerM